MSADCSDDDKDGPVKGRMSSSRPHESGRRERRKHRIASVREALIFRAVALVTHFRRDMPTASARNGKVRWGQNESFELTLTGRFRGCYHDFESGEGGDLFEFIMRQQGLSFADAVEWAARWAGLPSEYEPRADEARERKEQDAARAEKEAFFSATCLTLTPN